MGTVGAVALDRQGDMAAGTSTGGTQNKAPGRVGDTPVIGAGTYADNLAGAASATGWGEAILRVVLSKAAVDHMGAGHSPRDAGRQALATLNRVSGLAGLILIDPSGRVAAVFNTPRMARAWATEKDGLQAHVEREAKRG
jgi:beta-aspartyl-peptidase (threonine type)